LEFAIGVSYVMYKVCTSIVTISTVLMMKVERGRENWIKVFAFVFWVVVVVVSFVFQTHPIMHADSSKFKTFFTLGIGVCITFFIVDMPWLELSEDAEPSAEDATVGRCLTAE
jgi:hypothetical protein